ncbi:protein CcmA, bactofilin family [Salinihabitans flavidus]|uniref:Protein CcmA, bactofilin family n=1 Tax=Salinihabitans flavidus TaxID=569882 RepID=A0A1H8UHW5_9RHOB|nr:polymer-forming cytoskeletal protein [Salinihabitans flavidus]SEP02810.1 protein CcmA, bactofilin family [Salinihabitans flavidus]
MTEESRATSGSGGRSHLGAGSRITGELYFPGTVELPGYVNGSVEASAIVIEEAGDVEGELHAANITIKGRFKGQIKGGAVQLHTSARVAGDITYDSLSIESGAQVEGACIPRATPRAPTPTDQESGSAVE